MTSRRPTPAASAPPPTPPGQPPAPAFGYSFRDPELLDLALTHRSAIHESSRDRAHEPQRPDNEQLEFLGDAVLGLLVADSLYRRFPSSSEGELTRMRASLVSRKHLGSVAQRLHIASHLHLGPGLERGGGRTRPALLSNALEAILGAIYLDGGLEPARTFVESHIVLPSLSDLDLALQQKATFSGVIGDFKSALQERLQADGVSHPHYLLTAESGPGHDRRFRVEVHAAGPNGVTRPLASAEAPSKKLAQQLAARLALQALELESPEPPPAP